MVKALQILQPSEVLLEMSFKKKKAEQIVTGLAREINLHILSFDAENHVREHWKDELNNWLTEISIIRLIPSRLLYKWLYDELFGDNTTTNVEAFMRLLSRKYRRNETSVEGVAENLRLLHVALADRLSHNDPAYDLIDSL